MGLAKWIAKRGALGGMVRATFYKYKRARVSNPSASETEISEFLLRDRFGFLRAGEAARLKAILQSDVQVSTLRGTCMAIAEIEFAPRTAEQYRILFEVIEEELDRLGYAPRDASNEAM